MPEPLVSYAQNGEDVVLWRALSGVRAGHYVEVGANDPDVDSISKGFYDRGWHGITIEPVAQFLDRHRKSRPRDIQVRAAVTAQPVDEITLHIIADTGLSTLDDAVADRAAADGFGHEDVSVPARRLDAVLEESGWGHTDIHFVVVDVEGAEADVLASIDLTSWRPWVLVIEATEPRSATPSHKAWEPAVLAADYEFCLFDGLSRFYVAAERAAELKDALSYPACVLDEFVRAGQLAEQARYAERDEAARQEIERQRVQLSTLDEQIVHWRGKALQAWASAVSLPSPDTERAAALQRELDAVRRTVSWRVTAPLRGARRVGYALKRR